MLFSHLYIGVHVHHPIQRYTQLLQLYFLILLPPHRSASQYTFAGVKIVNSFIFQEFRHYLEYWNWRNKRHIILENWRGIWNFEYPYCRWNDIKMWDFRLRQWLVKTVFGDVMPTNPFNTTVMDDSTASPLTLKMEAAGSSKMSVPI